MKHVFDPMRAPWSGGWPAAIGVMVSVPSPARRPRTVRTRR
jgi:hypothetical protein